MKRLWTASKTATTVLPAALALTALSACVPYKNYFDMDPAAYSNAALAEGKGVSASKPTALWWREMDDSTLSGYIEKALVYNKDVLAAAARVDEARAIALEAGLNLLPEVTAEAGHTLQRNSEEGPTPVSNRTVDSSSANLVAGWELDLFGRVRAAAKNARENYQASMADQQAMQISVAAEVARAYIQLRGAEFRLAVANQNIAAQAETYRLTQALYEQGSTSRVDLDRAETLLSQTKATLPMLQAMANAQRNRLAVLVGETPQTFAVLAINMNQPLPNLPQVLAVGDIASLLQRRPDVRGDMHRVNAAIAAYNMQAADIFPRITLSGSVGFLATSFADLGASSALQYAVGPQLTWAAFDMGSVRARMKAAGAAERAQVAMFEKTVLEALEETDNAITNFRQEQARRKHLLDAATASARAEALGAQRFEAGVDSMIDLLDVQRSKLATQDALAESETQLALYLVDVYQALGGVVGLPAEKVGSINQHR